LGPFFWLFSKRFDNGLAVSGIFSLLPRIQANDVSTAIFLNLFDFKWRRLFRIIALSANLFVTAGMGQNAISNH
jgi:hypothetical protein